MFRTTQLSKLKSAQSFEHAKQLSIATNKDPSPVRRLAFQTVCKNKLNKCDTDLDRMLNTHKGRLQYPMCDKDTAGWDRFNRLSDLHHIYTTALRNL